MWTTAPLHSNRSAGDRKLCHQLTTDKPWNNADGKRHSFDKRQARFITVAPYTDVTRRTGRSPLRDLTPGQVITASMIRRAWVVKAGQSVQIIAQGEGFTINGEGKAMNNAAAGQAVRVRTANGQIISGITNEDGIILISQ
nr:flagellar basal body P-ring formation chaperone FlgA [Pectobacterium sp. PL152]